jgi:hypothetical protein
MIRISSNAQRKLTVTKIIPSPVMREKDLTNVIDKLEKWLISVTINILTNLK